MANKKLIFKAKEEALDSISKKASRDNKFYLFFDPDNITDFKAKIGKDQDRDSYLFEFIQVMWGNDEINEYILLDNKGVDLTQFGEIKKAVNAKYNFEYKYTLKKGLFSRYYYNVYFEYKNERYYLFIKTIAPRIDTILNNLKSNEEI